MVLYLDELVYLCWENVEYCKTCNASCGLCGALSLLSIFSSHYTTISWNIFDLDFEYHVLGPSLCILPLFLLVSRNWEETLLESCSCSQLVCHDSFSVAVFSVLYARISAMSGMEEVAPDDQKCRLFTD